MVALRFFVIAAWAAGAFAFARYVPPLATGSSLSAVLAEASPAVKAQLSSLKHFRLPLLAETVVVQHRVSGMSSTAQADAVNAALSFNEHPPEQLRQISAALPVINTRKVFPASSQPGTTALTYLLFRPSVSMWRQEELANLYASHYLGKPRDALVGVTGALVDENTQGGIIGHSLREVEFAALILIVLIVGVAFRSPLAPLLTLVTAGIAYLVSQGLLELATQHLGVTVPEEIGPIIDVLLLGIATDYTVFFLAAFRDDIVAGRSRPIVSGTAKVAPLVFVAGITVAGGVSAIAIAHLTLFSDLAPGLVITVAVTMLVAITFVPAVLAVVGRAAYWPSHLRTRAERDESRAVARRARGRIARLAVKPAAAVVVLVGSAAVMGLAASQTRHSTVGLNLLSDLPAGSAPARAATAAAAGFVPGVIAPTVVIVHMPNLGAHMANLEQLEALIAPQAGVAGVLGPGLKPTQAPAGVFVSNGGDYARYLVVFTPVPYGAEAISDLRYLQSQMPYLLDKAGLGAATAAYAGDTAISAEISQQALRDLIKVGGLAMLVNLAILAIFLRSLIAPLCLVAASGLVVLASFGLTTWFFPGQLGTPGFTFFVPVAVEVLLISFGSDYNLFLVGRIREMVASTRDSELRLIIARTTAEASAPINVAGITLAGCFAMLAVIDLNSFHEFTFAMVAGLILDTFLVRLLVVPSLLSLLGRHAGWHGRRKRLPRPR